MKDRNFVRCKRREKVIDRMLIYQGLIIIAGIGASFVIGYLMGTLHTWHS